MKVEFNTNRKIILCLFIFFVLLLPFIYLRDLNALNELKYLNIAQDALNRGTFFTFFENGVPYADKPPLYLWWCMAALEFFPEHTSFFILLISLISSLLTVYILDLFFGEGLSEQNRVFLAIGVFSSLFWVCGALLARMDMLFTFFTLWAFGLILKRAKEVITYGESAYGNFLIPFIIFLGIFTKGPYALLFPLVALFIALVFFKQQKLFFKIFRPSFFFIILLCVIVWLFGVLYEGGYAYAQNLFIAQSAKRLSGNLGHPRPFYYFGLHFWYLSLPISFFAFYGLLKLIRNIILNKVNASNLRLEPVFALSFSIAVFTVISFPSSKLEIYALPLIPTLFYFVGHFFSASSSIVRQLLFLGSLPSFFLLPIVILFKEEIPFYSEKIVISAAICSLSTLASYFLLKKGSVFKWLATQGGIVGVFVFSLSFSLSDANPYIGVKDLVFALEKGNKAINGVCVLEIKNFYTMKLYNSRFAYSEIKANDLFGSKCKNNHLLIGRKALKQDPKLRDRLIKIGAQFSGDNMVLVRK